MEDTDTQNLDYGDKYSKKKLQPKFAGELEFDEDKLKIYYDKAFPYAQMMKWLQYNKVKENKYLKSLDNDQEVANVFTNREFSFTLANDVYCRYLSFKNLQEFKEVLVERCPHKIDIGAVFNFSPSQHLLSEKKAFIPMEKEMVFDIDMTDYDNVRTCCTGAKVCNKCWEFMALATKVLHQILTVDFGFQNLLWVFSGRRGIHCWVCDEMARKFNNEQRTGVVDYINLNIGNELSGKLELSYPMHPVLKRAYGILQKKFQKIIIEDQNLLDNPKHLAYFIKVLPESIRENVSKKMGQQKSNIEKWEVYRNLLNSHVAANPKDQTMQSLVLNYLYPRIDANVSKGINHLLKSPFCVHPKTGKICVPFDPEKVENFDVNRVPKLTEVIYDIGQRKDEQDVIPALEGSLMVFNSFLKKINKDQIQQKSEKGDMNKIKHIERITNRELERLVPLSASWHAEYSDSAYIYIGGLHYRMNEGDIVIVFSQYGEVVDCRLVRDQKTGKSKGFAFLAYEDQRSTVLAVDNLNGIELCGRQILVDHVRQYRIPKEYLEPEEKPSDIPDDQNPEFQGLDEEEIAKLKWEKRLYKPTGPDGKGWGNFRQLNENDLELLQEIKKLEAKQQKHQRKVDALKELNEEKSQMTKEQLEQDPRFILDEDKRWEVMFRKQLEKEAEEQKQQEKDQMKQDIENIKRLIELKQQQKKKKDKKHKKDKHKKEKKKKEKKKRSRSRD